MSISRSALLIEKEIQGYKPTPEATEIVRSVPFLQVIGITGAGKDTVKKRLLATGNFHHIVSHTTRPPRADNGIKETDGVDYHFIDNETALHMIKVKGFVEAKWVHNSNLYGTSVSEFLMARDEGKTAVTDIDLQGVDEYLAISDKVYPLFLVPPSYEIWMQRLESRYLDNWRRHKADIRKRIVSAEKELEHVLSSDRYIPLVNDNIEDTLNWAIKVAQGGRLPPVERDQAESIMKSILKNIRENTV